MGGKLAVLMQPFELLIIGGSGFGAFMIANTPDVRSKALASLGYVVNGSPYDKKVIREILGLLTSLFKLIRSKGNLVLESHIENPESSPIFQKYPVILKDKKVREFICDYMRLMSMGSEDPMQIEDLMNEELDTLHKEHHKSVAALEKMADALPAMGIVAAVLGVIKSMGAINQPPEVLGYYIGAALTGTFLGVLLSYGLLGPMAQNVQLSLKKEHMVFECIKVAIVAHLHSNAPTISIEFARKSITSDSRPTFAEIEEIVLEA